ncbi:glycine receptor subunit alpha-4-like [Lineus longissimus]|uniref:glycine receptor subunit alpha-4-like n=1 Tax=Lineus longissimus TaxID=88925 RepID=UPI00315D95C6
MFFRQRWIDPRLAYTKYNTSLTLGYSRVSELWLPDTFFGNEKSGKSHSITVPNKLLRLYPNGEILYSQKVTLTLSCPMKLATYPHDRQSCRIDIESYGHTIDELSFYWYNDGDTISANPKLELPEFTFDPDNIELGNCSTVYNTGSYSCLYVQFTLKREFGYYLTGTYIPSMLIVVLSWISFFIDVRATPARISLGLLTVLTITTMNSGVRSTLPKVSYIKAVDVWMSACLTFVFAALLEFAIANMMARKEDQAKNKVTEIAAKKIKEVKTTGSVMHVRVEPLRDQESDSQESTSNEEAQEKASCKMKMKACWAWLTADRLEMLSLMIFPVIFLIFNLTYWCFYLTA